MVRLWTVGLAGTDEQHHFKGAVRRSLAANPFFPEIRERPGSPRDSTAQRQSTCSTGLQRDVFGVSGPDERTSKTLLCTPSPRGTPASSLAAFSSEQVRRRLIKDLATGRLTGLRILDKRLDETPSVRRGELLQKSTERAMLRQAEKLHRAIQYAMGRRPKSIVPPTSGLNTVRHSEDRTGGSYRSSGHA